MFLFLVEEYNVHQKSKTKAMLQPAYGKNNVGLTFFFTFCQGFCPAKGPAILGLAKTDEAI